MIMNIYTVIYFFVLSYLPFKHDRLEKSPKEQAKIDKTKAKKKAKRQRKAKKKTDFDNDMVAQID